MKSKKAQMTQQQLVAVFLFALTLVLFLLYVLAKTKVINGLWAGFPFS